MNIHLHILSCIAMVNFSQTGQMKGDSKRTHDVVQLHQETQLFLHIIYDLNLVIRNASYYSESAELTASNPMAVLLQVNKIIRSISKFCSSLN